MGDTRLFIQLIKFFQEACHNTSSLESNFTNIISSELSHIFWVRTYLCYGSSRPKWGKLDPKWDNVDFELGVDQGISYHKRKLWCSL